MSDDKCLILTRLWSLLNIYISKSRDRCPEDMTHRKESPLNSGDFVYGMMRIREADLLPGAESRMS